MPSPRPVGISSRDGKPPVLRFMFPNYRDLCGRSTDLEVARARQKALRLLRSRDLRVSYEAQVIAAKARTIFPLLLRRLRPAMRREVESHMAPSPWTRCPKCGGQIEKGRCIGNRNIHDRVNGWLRWVRCQAVWVDA